MSYNREWNSFFALIFGCILGFLIGSGQPKNPNQETLQKIQQFLDRFEQGEKHGTQDQDE